MNLRVFFLKRSFLLLDIFYKLMIGFIKFIDIFVAFAIGNLIII